MKYSNYVLTLFCIVILCSFLSAATLSFNSPSISAICLSLVIIFAVALVNAPDQEKYKDYKEWEKKNSDKTGD